MLKRLVIWWLLNGLIESFIRQSSLITKPLDENLFANEFVFVLSKANYSLIRNADRSSSPPSITNLMRQFLSEGETIVYPDAKKIYGFQQIDYKNGNSKSIEIYSKRKSLAYKNPGIPTERDQQQQLNEGAKEFSDPILAFHHQGGQYICLVYFTHTDEPRIGIVKHLWFESQSNSNSHFTYRWQKRSSSSTPMRLFAHNAKIAHLIYADEFRKYDEEDEEEKEKLNGEDLPFVSFLDFNKGRGKFRMYEMPILCSGEKTYDKSELYTSIIDVFQDRTELGTAYYILAKKINGMAICVLHESIMEKFLETAAQKRTSDFICELSTVRANRSWSLFDESICRPKELRFASVMMTADLIDYKRVLVKTKIVNRRKESVVFLLDKLNRLMIYSVEHDRTSVQRTCFEGVFKLLNSDIDEILDMKLDEQDSAIIVLTAKYIQKIPFQSFCLADSPFSTCDGRISVCNIGKRMPIHCRAGESKRKECIEPSRIGRFEPIKSESFLCDLDRHDWEMCLLGDERMIQVEHRKSFRFCGEKSCICQLETCLRTKCNEHVIPLTCPLDKTSLNLPDFSIDSRIEPQYIIIVSSFLTFLSITTILVVFYCCFAISQSNKRQIGTSQISTVDLSKLEYREDS